MKKVSLLIEYAGLQLQITKNEYGQDVTPLKPIADLFGLNWEGQRKKVTESPFLIKLLGICTVACYGSDGQKREQNCILLSSIAIYLARLNPDQVRAHGSDSAADFLEEKITEWADALHDYEELGSAINMSHAKIEAARFKNFLSLCKEKRMTEGQAECNVLGKMMKDAAEKLGYPYQNELE